jgi:hypothetical protein
MQNDNNIIQFLHSFIFITISGFGHHFAFSGVGIVRINRKPVEMNSAYPRIPCYSLKSPFYHLTFGFYDYFRVWPPFAFSGGWQWAYQPETHANELGVSENPMLPVEITFLSHFQRKI